MDKTIQNASFVQENILSGTQPQTKKQRESGLEILRILAMFLIVCHHYVVHNLAAPDSGTTTAAFFAAFSSFGKFGVNVFVLISGYFLYKEKFKLKKLLKLIFQLSFFQFTIALAFLLFDKSAGITWQVLIRQLFSITLAPDYWFASAYLLLYILFPFLNIILNNIGKNLHLLIVLVLFVGLSVLPVILRIEIPYLFTRISWFVFLYFVAAYIGKYVKNTSNKFFIFAILLTVLQIVLCFFLPGFTIKSWLSSNSFEYNLRGIFLYNLNSCFVTINSVCWLLAFKNLKFHNKIINIISAATFSTYLIHENSFIREFLWKKIFVSQAYFYSINIIWHAFISVFLVFAICLIIGVIYNFTVSKLFSKLFDKHIDNFQESFVCCFLKTEATVYEQDEQIRPVNKLRKKMLIGIVTALIIYILLLFLFHILLV